MGEYDFDPLEENEGFRREQAERFDLTKPGVRSGQAALLLNMGFITGKQFDRLLKAKNRESFLKLKDKFLQDGG
ncbi:hypothetical protein A3D00_05180 [Candidatus Woesebacteria bacterium RIFCSPHIGHO2_02_FULL_38_9]|uniref:Uncharacterized protein n=1 Tax=Candidatus Woesebacteria bacterium RIFCSPHIGHO2_01_FULL_39_28 TaxID=1802496 RepID=A0A1F7Y8W4_9BACT|nr:MAG: hypothetical protein A2627_05280 [Candidatus Woesebacteria bacterium RIFCSPHIGHO2_01_FULL_39_28]OGM34579.1 MAG: hypothetical protein A3D00_05180 [Candidatus Woesebacteria bacterium RIFCSPHIGHO2_02_FULL_38_9]